MRSDAVVASSFPHCGCRGRRHPVGRMSHFYETPPPVFPSALRSSSPIDDPPVGLVIRGHSLQCQGGSNEERGQRKSFYSIRNTFD